MARARKSANKQKSLSAKAKRQLAAAKGAATRRRKRELELESIRLSEIEYERTLDETRAKKARAKRKRLAKAKRTARQKATRAQKGGGKSLLFQLIDAYEHMQSTSPYPVLLSVENSPVREKGTQPWLLSGVFLPDEPITWAELGGIFKVWEDDFSLAVTLHPQRYALISVMFQKYDEDGEAVGAPEGYSPGSSGPWEYVISEARANIIGGDQDDPDEESVAARYTMTQILEFEILLSASLA